MESTIDTELWQKRISAARKHREMHEDNWADYARLHTNAYIAAQAKNDSDLVVLPNGDQIKLGLVFRNIEQTMGFLEMPEIGIRATAEEFDRELGREDQHRESVVESALVRSIKRSGAIKREEATDFIKRDGLIIGHGINYSWWRVVEREVEGPPMPVIETLPDGSFAPLIDASSGQAVLEPQMESQVVYEGVQDEHVSPLTFLFDHTASSLLLAGWHGMEPIIKLDELRADSRFEIPDDIEGTSFRERNIYGEDQDDQFIDKPDSARLIVVWDKLNYELIYFIEARRKQDFVRRDNQGKLVGDRQKLDMIQVGFEKWPVMFDHPDDSPFSFYVPIPANDHPFGISQVEHIKNPAAEADKTRTRQANMTRQMKRLWVYAKGKVDEDQLNEAINGKDNSAVGWDMQEGMKISDVLVELPLPHIIPELYQQEALAEDTVRKTSGVSEVPWTGADTATESENMNAVGSARPDRKRRLYLDFLTHLATVHKAFLAEFAPPGQTIRAIGADGVPLQLPYGREAFAGQFDIEVLPGGEAMAVSPVKQKMLVEIANLFLGRYGMVFDKVLARQILTMADIRNINAMLEAMPEQYMMPQKGVDGQARADAFNPNDLSNGQAIRAAVNPGE